MAALTRSPAQTAAAAEREAKRKTDQAERQRATLARQSGANWALTGRGTAWLNR
jgi:hypothetical protein